MARPCAGCGNTVNNTTCACSVADTDSITWTGTGAVGSPLEAALALDPDADNQASVSAAGLLVPSYTAQTDPAGLVTYTPTWTATGATAVGNGTLKGRYREMGQQVYFIIHLTFGSTTNGASGAWSFALPFATLADIDQVVSAYADDSTSRYAGTAHILAGATTVSRIAGGAATALGWGATLPFTWGSGDQLIISGVYEQA